MDTSQQQPLETTPEGPPSRDELRARLRARTRASEQQRVSSHAKTVMEVKADTKQKQEDEEAEQNQKAEEDKRERIREKKRKQKQRKREAVKENTPKQANDGTPPVTDVADSP